MRSLKTLLTVIGAVTVLVLAGNTVALAATGHALILGKTNKASKATTLKRTTSGAALNLHTKSSASAPMSVNGTGKVANLNADTLDGLDSSALGTNGYVLTKDVTVPTTDIDLTITLPPGSYLLGYSAYLAGGGSDGLGAGCYFRRSVNGTGGTAVGETRVATRTAVDPALSGNGIMSVGPGVTLELKCFAPAAFTTLNGEPIQVTAIRTNVVGTGSL